MPNLEAQCPHTVAPASIEVQRKGLFTVKKKPVERTLAILGVQPANLLLHMPPVH